jgi:carbon-monoxide dehydrogenase large subunit
MPSIGSRVRRLEDARLLLGRGRFVDDVDRPGQLWLRVVRSQMAHAQVRAIHADDALALKGVYAVLTGDDLRDVPPIPVRTRVSDHTFEPYVQPVLARGRVRYVGEPVAALVAEDPYLAEDAAEWVVIEYEPLPPVLDARRATSPGSSVLFEGNSNEAAVLSAGYGDVATAMARAAHVVRAELSIGRHSGVPLETRGLVAEYDRAAGRLEIWGATKVPHFNRRVLAGLLDLPEERIHLHPSDAGGGFGVRGEFYPEDFLVPFLARRTGRPMKWVEDRSEHLMATNQSREQHHRIEAAFDGEGRLLGLVDEIWHDNGAYLRTHGVLVPDLTVTMLPGPYRVPAYLGTVHVALTNKTPCGTYRGPGRYEGTFARERLLDLAAHELGIDPVELRRRNLLRPDELPLERELTAIGTELVLDAGDYPGLLDEALERSGFSGWQDEAVRLRAEGRCVGTGVGVFLEKSGLGPVEHAGVDVEPSGRVRVLAGSASLGQGVETVLAQIAAEELDVDPAEVEVVLGDTDLVPEGVGSWASRTTVVAGSAVMLAARAVAEQAREVAAEILETAPADLRLAGGRLEVAGSPARGVSLSEAAAHAASTRGGPGLSARRSFSVDHMTYPYGVHLAQVEIDPETGGVRVHRYVVAYEVGRAVNPTLVEGQLVGGAAQGIAGALMEQFRYDDAGQPLSVSLTDYLVPTAREVPDVGTILKEDWPAAGNPLGVRGAGEGGASGCGAAIAAAIEDALGVPGSILALPVTPERVLAILRGRSETHEGSDG